MKKVFLFALAALTALSLAACQPTPKESIVKGKNLEKMIDSATKTKPPAATGATAVPAGATIAQQMGVQPQYAKELSDATGKVKIHVNANVVVPDAKGVTVQRVLPEPFTQSIAATLIGKLVKGKDQMFDADTYKLSKAEIQQQILNLEAAITQQSGEGGANANPKLSGDARKLFLQSQLDDLKKQLETAPDAETKTPSDGKLHAATDGSEGQTVHALAQTAQGGYESFWIVDDNKSSASFARYSSEKNTFSDSMGYFYSKDSVAQAEASGYHTAITSADIAKIPDIQLTEEQAKAKAQDLLQALGIDNMMCYSADNEYGGSEASALDGLPAITTGGDYANPRKCVWFLRYARSVNGIPATYTVWDCMKVEEDTQSAPWAYEDMTFAIDDSGIVGFEWRSPYQVTDTVTENSNVMSFAEAMNVFDTMSLAVNAWDGYAEGNPDLKGIDIDVSEIRFGLTRITEQDKRNSGLLVPAWDFMANVTYISETDGKTREMVDGPVPILTINAIDGSVINRSLGY